MEHYPFADQKVTELPESSFVGRGLRKFDDAEGALLHDCDYWSQLSKSDMELCVAPTQNSQSRSTTPWTTDQELMSKTNGDHGSDYFNSVASSPQRHGATMFVVVVLVKLVNSRALRDIPSYSVMLSPCTSLQDK